MRKIVLAIVLLILTMNMLFSQIIQQEFLHPSKVRKNYKLKEFKTILFADDEVYKSDPEQMNKEYIESSGYRIQLISTQNLSEAITIKTQADSLYSVPVYVDFEPPNYKVRIGNYITKEEAMGIQTLMQEQGFKNAWLVPSKIVIIK
ncbi:MAG: SPOR domain-containing protein [Candidatus Marinimicrobia bacterium]|nr:SPOR domain-containing protein [Candidatus Neomarinimicrobiota bacterium]